MEFALIREVFLDPNHLQVSKSQERDTWLLTRSKQFSFIADKCHRCSKEKGVDSGGTDKGALQQQVTIQEWEEFYNSVRRFKKLR